jgi:RNA polymerase sigma-70 factor (ECF subfamily)
MVLCKDRAAADDLAQTTCERALNNAEKFQPGTALDRWLFTLARRIWLNDLRAAKVRQGNGVISVEDHDLEDHKTNTETNIFASEVLNKVHSLPIGQRLAVLLVYVEGYSYREAAGILDIPIGTVMSRLSAARATLAGLAQESEA